MRHPNSEQTQGLLRGGAIVMELPPGTQLAMSWPMKHLPDVDTLTNET